MIAAEDLAPSEHPPGARILTAWSAVANLYACRGCAVLPLGHGSRDKEHDRSKIPETRNGVKDASREPEQIQAWFGDGLTERIGGIGIATGAASGVVVLDVDPRNNGEESLAGLIAEHGPLPDTLTAETGRGDGGRHYYFAIPKGAEVAGRVVANGLDLKGAGGYVVAPPSVHSATGERYRWTLQVDPAPCPAWLLDAGKPEAPKREPSWPSATEGTLGAVDAAASRLGAAFERAGMLGRPLTGGKRTVVCPWEDEHTGGSEHDSSTIITPAKESGGLGWFHCSHNHCSERGGTEAIRELERLAAEVLCKLHHTDAGNAERFVRMHGRNVRYCVPLRQWLIWDGKRFAPDEREEIMKLAIETSRMCWRELDCFSAETEGDKRKAAAKAAIYAESRQGLSNMVALAQSACAVLADDLDSDPFALNCSNGTIDLRTGVLRPHRREDLITKIAPVVFDPEARHALWDGCVKQVAGGDLDLEGYMQRSLGYALLGEWREKAFWFGYGPPDGGKSTFLGAVGNALGEYHVATKSDTWLARRDVGGNRGDVVRLRGARLVTCSEFKRGAKFDERLMKAVTGGDPMTEAKKYADDITFRVSFSLWFAANDAPTIADDDDGMWRRTKRVPFTNRIAPEKQDPSMQDKLRAPEVAAAVLAWCVRGLRAYLAEGLGTCAAVDASTDDYRKENDTVAPFFEEACVMGEFTRKDERGTLRAGSTQTKALRDAYDEWARRARVRPVDAKAFAAKIRALPGVTQAPDVKGCTAWFGIRVRL